MNLSRSITGLGLLLVLLAGCNTEDVFFYAEFEDVTGLSRNAKVTAKGNDVGTVRTIDLAEDLSVLVLIDLQDKMFLPPLNSEVALVEVDLLGTGGLEIQQDSTLEQISIGDTLNGVRLKESLTPEQEISQMLNTLGGLLNKEENDSLLQEIDRLRFKVDSLELLKSKLDSVNSNGTFVN